MVDAGDGGLDARPMVGFKQPRCLKKELLKMVEITGKGADRLFGRTHGVLLDR
jgi:hypothetical protein